MNATRLLMAISAAALDAVGLAGLFASEVALAVSGAPVNASAKLIAQLAGVLCLGFAALNWMARAT